MATFFSKSTNQRDLAAGAGDMQFHHYAPSNNPYSDSSVGGLIPLPATIMQQAHGGGEDGRDDEHAAYGNARDAAATSGEMGLQTQLLMAQQQQQQQGLSLSLGTHGVPMSFYQYRPAGTGTAMAGGGGASLIGVNQSPTAAAAAAAGMRSAHQQQGGNIYVQNSRYLRAARQLLDEVVTVRDAIKRKGDRAQGKDSGEGKADGEKSEEKGGGEHEGNSSAPELTASERQDLQNKVSALMALLDQVDRKYRQYRHQMQAVMTSFDAVAGSGAARPYTALALQTISRHFRSLRDTIGSQAQSLRRSLGEKETSGQGGGLARLRYIDQHLRQQRAMQQFGMVQQPQHAWRPQRGLPESAVSVLRAWLFEHFLHPYPKDSEKVMLARQTGLSRGQVSNWFINARVRLWKPMIEEMYKEEFGAAMDSHSSSENNKGKDEAASTAEDHDEFQSPSSAATAKAHHHHSTFKSEANMDVAGGLSGLDGASGMGPYATSLNLSHQGQRDGNGSFLQDALGDNHNGGGDPRFVAAAYGDMAGHHHLGGYDAGGSVSLTLGLQHFNDAMPAEHHQGLLYGGGGDFEFMNGGGEDSRQRFGSSQLLHDFVA